MPVKWILERYKLSDDSSRFGSRFREYEGQTVPEGALFTPIRLHPMLKLCEEVCPRPEIFEKLCAVRVVRMGRREYAKLKVRNAMLDEYKAIQDGRNPLEGSAFDQYISEPPCNKAEVQFRVSWHEMEARSPKDLWSRARQNLPEEKYVFRTHQQYVSKHSIESEKGLKIKDILDLYQDIGALADFEPWDLLYNAAQFHQLIEELEPQVRQAGVNSREWPGAVSLPLRVADEAIIPDGDPGIYYRKFLSCGPYTETHASLDAVVMLPGVVAANAENRAEVEKETAKLREREKNGDKDYVLYK